MVEKYSVLTHWIGEPKEVTKDMFGFLYQIKDLNTGKSYIGIKQFWNKKTLPALKGRTTREKLRRAGMKGNKRHRVVESKWREYLSSNPLLPKLIKERPEDFVKVILKICYSKTELKIEEAYYQLRMYKAGRWDELYNEMINLRIRLR